MVFHATTSGTSIGGFARCCIDAAGPKKSGARVSAAIARNRRERRVFIQASMGRGRMLTDRRAFRPILGPPTMLSPLLSHALCALALFAPETVAPGPQQ